MDLLQKFQSLVNTSTTVDIDDIVDMISPAQRIVTIAHLFGLGLAILSTQPFIFKVAASKGPSDVHKLATAQDYESCKYANINGFLKEVCTIDNLEYYRCSRSNRFYRTTTETCLETLFTYACPNDTVFYQACGRKTCSKRQLTSQNKKLITSDSNPWSKIAVCGEVLCVDEVSQQSGRK